MEIDKVIETVIVNMLAFICSGSLLKKERLVGSALESLSFTSVSVTGTVTSLKKKALKCVHSSDKYIQENAHTAEWYRLWWKCKVKMQQ